MQSFRLYFAFAILVGAALVWAARSLEGQQVEEVYGFAQTAQTEINYNYPVEVREILVHPGESVRAGQVLMRLQRARPREELADQDFRIRELAAEDRLALQRLDAERRELASEYALDSTEISQRRATLLREAGYRRELQAVLTPDGSSSSTGYDPLDAQVSELDAELQARRALFNASLQNLNRRRDMLNAPRRSAAERLAAERDFEAAQADFTHELIAPANGVIGSINAKLAEHKSAFAPLVVFYEPNPGEVLAYIHEDRLLDAAVGDSVLVSSVSADKPSVPGKITGLGSRVVEIPSRLRRMPELRTYGREVIVAIPVPNAFLQSEKVRLTLKSGDR